MNTRASAIAVGLLVLATLVLSVLSLAFFIIEENRARDKIIVSGDVDEIYVKEDLLNFYIQDIFDKASEDFLIEEGVGVFEENFKRELGNYKTSDGKFPIMDLEGVEDIVDEGLGDNIEVSGDRLVLRLDLFVERVSGKLDIDYSYQKEFVRIL